MKIKKYGKIKLELIMIQRIQIRKNVLSLKCNKLLDISKNTRNLLK